MRWAPIHISFCRTSSPTKKMGPKPQTCSLTGLLRQGGLKEQGHRGVERSSVPDLAMLPHACPHACSWPHVEQVADPQAGVKWELPSLPAQHWFHDGDALLHVGSCSLSELPGLSRGISPSQSAPRLWGQFPPYLHAAKGKPFPKGACSLGEGRTCERSLGMQRKVSVVPSAGSIPTSVITSRHGSVLLPISCPVFALAIWKLLPWQLA